FSLVSHLLFSVFFLLVFSSTHPATPHFYTLSLHDALPISILAGAFFIFAGAPAGAGSRQDEITAVAPDGTFDRRAVDLAPRPRQDRESTRLNSSHRPNSYAVFFF